MPLFKRENLLISGIFLYWYSKKLDRLLSSIAEKPYKKTFYKPNCTRILLPFLVELQLQPKGVFQQIPSLYLKGLLNGR